LYGTDVLCLAPHADAIPPPDKTVPLSKTPGYPSSLYLHIEEIF
jgi:hypothetical protein